MKKYIIMLLCGLSLSFAQDYLGDEDDVRYSVFGGINLNGGVEDIVGFDTDGFSSATIGFRYNIDEKQDIAIQMSQIGGEDSDGTYSLEGFDLSYNYTFFDNLTLAGYVGGVYSMMTEENNDGFFPGDEGGEIIIQRLDLGKASICLGAGGGCHGTSAPEGYVLEVV